MAVRHPPGRSGRIWLAGRLGAARRGAEVLDVKLHALIGEEARLAAAAEDARRRWQEAAGEAARWELRAAMLGGADQFVTVPVLGGGEARAEVRWEAWMGVTYPRSAEVRPAAPAVTGVGGTAALDVAAPAFAVAVEAALAAAALDRGLELVRAELADTRRRWRTLTNRWTPLLEAELRLVEQSLEEQEREDGVRARWVRSRTGGSTG